MWGLLGSLPLPAYQMHARHICCLSSSSQFKGNTQLNATLQALAQRLALLAGSPQACWGGPPAEAQLLPPVRIPWSCWLLQGLL